MTLTLCLLPDIVIHHHNILVPVRSGMFMVESKGMHELMCNCPFAKFPSSWMTSVNTDNEW